MYSISNEQFKMVFSDRGAEIQSLVFLRDQLELIWQGDPAYWPDRSPLLFPAVGDWKDNHYIYEGHLYDMPLHGFARTSNFTVDLIGSDKAHLALTPNDEIRAIYPFEFTLDITYRLMANGLCVDQSVSNLSATVIPYSIGEHVGFRAPLFDAERYEDYYLEFEQAETAERYPLIGNRVLGAPIKCLDKTKRIHLESDMFANGAFNFRGLKSRNVTLGNNVNPYRINMSYAEFEYLSFWSVPGGRFVCIEPCNGAAASENESYDIFKKDGIRLLRPGETHTFHYSISLNI